jgi:hypothetical protein
MRTIALISCGKSKRREKAPAQQLYTGALFQKSLAYARRIKSDEIYILSAHYGLVELTQEIAPYEKTACLRATLRDGETASSHNSGREPICPPTDLLFSPA